VDTLKLLKPDLASRDTAIVPDRESLAWVHRKCPRCHSPRSFPSRPKGKYEAIVLPLMFRQPRRCRVCTCRFYSFDLGRDTFRQMFTLMGLAACLAYLLWQLLSYLFKLNIHFNMFE
jgi:hypothetical protein